MNYPPNGRMNGACRPASTGLYLSLWETKIQELMELLTHTSLETHKLDLMAEISSLKLKLAAAEKDRRELDERCRSAQRQIAELEAKVLIKDAEMAEMRQRLIRNGTVIMPERGETEVEKLKKAVDTLMVSNEDKDRRLEDMRRLLKRYRRVEEILVQAQGRKAVEELLQNVEDDTSSTSSSTTPSIHDTSMRDHFNNDDFNNRHAMSSPSATSTPVHYTDSSRINGTHGSTAAHSLPASARQALGMTRSNSCENIAVTPEKGAADGRKKGSNHNGGSSYGTLPKQGTASYSSTPSRNREGASIERDISANSSSSSAARRSRGFPMLGKTLLRIRSGKRSSSAPNLGEATPSSLHEAPVKPRLLICMLQTYMQPPSFFPFLPSFPVPPIWKLIASQSSCRSFCFMARHWSVAGHVTDAP